MTNSNINKDFWFDTIYGSELFCTEQKQVSQYFTKIFGLKILQIGCPQINYLDPNCKIHHKILLSNSLSQTKADATDNRSILYCRDNYIPLATDSIDAVVLAHDLEFSENPHAVLREVDRVLLPDGHLIILGFNPWSLWGIRCALTNGKEAEFPWNGSWLSCHRICDWLNLLDYEVTDKDFHFFKPCIDNEKLLNSMRFFEQIGKIIPLGAAAFSINAKKKQAVLTPLKAKWQNDIELVGAASYAEPTIRDSLRNTIENN